MELPQKTKFDEYVKMGLVRSQTKDDLTVYQYTEVTQYDRLWNGPTMLARGIVFDDDGEVVQRCIPKFFNFDEPDGRIAAKMLGDKMSDPLVQDKLDGSLIKVTSDQKHGLVVTSKASFESVQAKWAMEIIEEEGYIFSSGLTYHFELIHPENQIVLNYGGRRELVLFAVVINENGKELNLYNKEELYQNPEGPAFKIVERLSPEVLNDVNKLNEAGLSEGVVANYGGLRLKMKTDEYVRLHRIVTNFTPKRVWEALSEGQTIDRQNIPEEFLNWLEDTENDLRAEYAELDKKISDAVEATKDLTNKEVGLSDNPMKNYIFYSRSGKDLSEAIWKAIKPKGD